MKTLIKRYSYLAVIAILSLMTFASCQDTTYSFDKPLAVTSNTFNLTSALGSTPVIVYSSGSWTASFTEPVDWASLDRLSGEGIDQVKFSYSQNYGRARKVGIIFESSGMKDTVMMVQAAGLTDPIFYLDQTSVTVPSNPDKATMIFHTNLKYDVQDVESAVVYDDSLSQPWLSDINVALDSLDFKVAENTGSADRKATITLSHTDALGATIKTSVVVTQLSTGPKLTFDESTVNTGFQFLKQTISIPVETNLLLFGQRTLAKSAQVKYEGSQSGWIDTLYFDSAMTRLSMDIAQNENSTPRTAVVTFTYTDAAGHSYTFPVTITQKKGGVYYTFDQIKTLAASGTYTINDDAAILEAYVIGDKDSKNMEVNPNLAKKSIDYTVNDKCNYIQNADGTSGFRIFAKTVADNNMTRYSRIIISLKGITVTKEDSPERYTLDGYEAADLIVSEDGTATSLPVKLKSISEIKPSDVYTYVTLRNLEFVFKSGAYTDVHDGYAVKDATLNPNGAGYVDASTGSGANFFDCSPCPVRDPDGHSIYMLFNSLTPWRRTGSGVPQGEVRMSGIVVHSNLIRFAKDGDLGDYSIRVLKGDDIVSTGVRFSNVLVEWDLNIDKCTTFDNAIIPSTGTGNFTCSLSDATTGVTNDFNNVVNNSSASGQTKGFVTNGTIRWASSKWWDTSKDLPPYFELTFSTAGITGKNLVFNWTAASGNSSATTIFAPANWHLEYSTDGINFTRIDKDYAIRPIVWWTTASLSSIPGLHEYSSALPSSLFNQTRVYVRIVASSKVAASTELPEGGSVSQMNTSTYIRFGELSVQYN